MAAYRFRLERLLRLRQQQAALAEKQLWAAREQQAAALRMASALQDRVAERSRQLLARERRGLPAWDLARARQHAAGLRRQALQVAAGAEQAAQAVTRCRRELALARQRERILERLRDRQQARHRETVRHREAEQADAAALVRHGRG